MTIKHIAFIVAYGVMCFVGSIAFVQCSERSAQKAVKMAEFDVQSARASLGIALAENARLSEDMAKYDGVLKEAIAAIEKAYKSHVERVEEIHDLPDDWLQCELPSGVQDVFADYCYDNAESEAARIVAESMRKAGGK